MHFDMQACHVHIILCLAELSEFQIHKRISGADGQVVNGKPENSHQQEDDDRILFVLFIIIKNCRNAEQDARCKVDPVVLCVSYNVLGIYRYAGSSDEWKQSSKVYGKLA